MGPWRCGMDSNIWLDELTDPYVEVYHLSRLFGVLQWEHSCWHGSMLVCLQMYFLYLHPITYSQLQKNHWEESEGCYRLLTDKCQLKTFKGIWAACKSENAEISGHYKIHQTQHCSVSGILLVATNEALKHAGLTVYPLQVYVHGVCVCVGVETKCFSWGYA